MHNRGNTQTDLPSANAAAKYMGVLGPAPASESDWSALINSLPVKQSNLGTSRLSEFRDHPSGDQPAISRLTAASVPSTNGTLKPPEMAFANPASGAPPGMMHDTRSLRD